LSDSLSSLSSAEFSIAGVEGRISVLKRKHGLGRFLYHGEDGFERWVGWGVIAGNLTVMATALAARG
jgi:hypothetical protein